MEVVSPKEEAEVSASLCGGEVGPERCVSAGPELEGSSDLTLALGVPFCVPLPFKGGRGHWGWKEKKYMARLVWLSG